MNILKSFVHDDFQVVINMIEHQKVLLAELRGIVLPILPTDNGQTKLALQLLGDILNCSDKAISMLELGGNTDKLANLARGKRKGDKHIMENHNLEETKQSGIKRRKNTQDTCSIVTQEPYNDGHQWRKYGHKWISRAKHYRSYYRCANSKVQGCLATKRVQQMEDSGNGTLKLFNVNYYGQHICKGDGIANPYVVDTQHEHQNVAPINRTQCNSPTFAYDSNGVQDERFENLFVMPNMSVSEYLTDLEMERAFEVTMNSPSDSEHWMFDNLIRCDQSPLCIWGW
ncbi:hypothetical protein GUJ93_ZPchr0009g1828 [Zizania palustris]|uniref:WRKY domain-containing protein n=1 Tax=Zizania palustris TaxID=103762 RepID=A0A8J5RNK9_ZIZPA|nr:hypothetical protein GUJ93_ZPchr0009g1828 [Zizania palustris]